MREYLYWFLDIVIEQIRGIYVYQLLLLLIVCGIVILIPGYVLVKTNRIRLKRLILCFFTALYLGIILLITVMRREPGSYYGMVETELDFGGISGGYFHIRQIMYSLLNVLLFIPWGTLLVMFRKKYRKEIALFMTVLECFITSFFIEITQLVTATGRFEITDIVTNVLGGAIGATCGLIIHLCRERFNQNER